MTDDLWPDFKLSPERKAPVYLLKEQAARLSSKTDNMVRGDVFSLPYGPDKFAFGLEFSSPAISGYSFRLLTISYPLEFYPLTLSAFGTDSTATDEENFRKMLSSVFQEARTKQIVEAIMAQALALKEK